MTIVAVSGGFDPLHVGHVRMIKMAATMGRVVVILNNDNWLRAKKGFVFMPEDERREILESMRDVDKVIMTYHAHATMDLSVNSELHDLRPDIFANGGDVERMQDVLEYQTCQHFNIAMRFHIGGPKVTSSSALVRKAADQLLGVR